MQALAEILRRLQARYPKLGVRVRESQGVVRWEDAVGPKIARRARPMRVIEGTLWVEVDHPAWKTELHHRSRQILERLNAEHGPDEARWAIRELRFTDRAPGRPPQEP